MIFATDFLNMKLFLSKIVKFCSLFTTGYWKCNFFMVDFVLWFDRKTTFSGKSLDNENTHTHTEISGKLKRKKAKTPARISCLVFTTTQQFHEIVCQRVASAISSCQSQIVQNNLKLKINNIVILKKLEIIVKNLQIKIL